MIGCARMLAVAVGLGGASMEAGITTGLQTCGHAREVMPLWVERLARSAAMLVLIALAAVGRAAPAAAVTPEEFLLRSGADVVALCSTPSGDPLYTAAVHMCHGFGAGTYQTILALTRHEKIEPVMCPPEPPVSRNEAVRRFIEWAKDNPRYLTEPAVEVMGRFLITQFPCRAK